MCYLVSQMSLLSLVHAWQLPTIRDISVPNSYDRYDFMGSRARINR